MQSPKEEGKETAIIPELGAQIIQKGIEENRDHEALLVAADWYAEQGREYLGVGLRWVARQRKAPRWGPIKEAWAWHYEVSYLSKLKEECIMPTELVCAPAGISHGWSPDESLVGVKWYYDKWRAYLDMASRVEALMKYYLQGSAGGK